MTNQESHIQNVDWWMVIMYLVLVAFGWMNIYSTQSEDAEIFDLSRKHGAQLMWIGLAIFSSIVVLIINSQFYSVFAYPLYAAVLFLLVIVLLFGIKVNGSTSWLGVGAYRFQPAELAKMATSLALARWMGNYDFKLNTSESWLGIAFIILLPVALILLQKDWGSAIVFSCFVLMLYREGMTGWVLIILAFMVGLFIAALLLPPTWLLWYIFLGSILLYGFLSGEFVLMSYGLGLFALPILIYIYFFVNDPEALDASYYWLLGICSLSLCCGLIYSALQRVKSWLYVFIFFVGSVSLTFSVDYIYDNMLKSHHRDRIEDMLGIKADIQNTGYNVYQSKVAIGSGGVLGKGYLQGTQTKYNFVPEQSTDFIFCTIGEEWGYVGSCFTVILYLSFLLRLIYLAERQKYAFSRIYGYCVAGILFFHFAINLGMTIGLAPVIGIPLPFISAGGSSLWSFTLLVFIFLKLDSVRYGEK